MTAVVGRDRELANIASLFDAPGDGARILVIQGEAGIGKTTLWRAGIDVARDAGYRVLACAGAEAEAQLSFTALRDLVGEVFDEVADELPAPQRDVLAVVLLRDEGRDISPSPDTIAVSLLSTLRALAARSPTLLAVDDVQWLDGPSAASLGYALRRLDDAALPVLLSRRTEAHSRSSVLDRLDRERLQVFEVGPLTIGALGNIVHARLGVAHPRPTLTRLFDVSGGNPFVALELARALGDPARPLVPGSALPVPQTLRELLGNRLAALPAETLEVLTFAAALSRPTLELVAVALGRDPLPSLEPAMAADVADVDGGRIRFAHPLFAATVYSLASTVRRRDTHRRLAEVVTDAEERARHLALASDSRDASVAEALEAAALLAAQRGASAVAAELGELAAERTPEEETELRWRRLTEAGLRYATSGDFRRARALLEPMIEEMPPGTERGRVLLNLADISWDDRPRMITLAEQALTEIGADDVSRARLHSLLAENLWEEGSETTLHHLRAALEAGERADDEETTVLALVNLIRAEVMSGQLTSGVLERALALADVTDGRMLPRVPHFENPGATLGAVLGRLDRFEEARVLLDRAREDGLAQGAYPAVSFTCHLLTQLLSRMGEWPRAAFHAAECAELVEELGLDDVSPDALHAQALVDVHLGNVEAARAGATRCVEIGDGFERLRAEALLGFLELSLGNAAAAVDHFLPALERVRAGGWRDPWADVKPNAIESLVAVGELEQAAELLAEVDEWARAMDAPAARAAGLRCRGLLCAARGNDDAAFAAFAEAVQLYGGLPTPFERGRTLLALGSTERRARKQKRARQTLQDALAVFEELGASLWADQARNEFARVGGRAPASDELTPSEQRIAELVAEGKTNKEVAAILVIADRTVESALTQIYRKLDIRSRTELARMLAARG
jgi:DNA-binding CsgD family transcriptional regulator